VIESILSAQFLRVKNSASPWRRGQRERLYIIDSFNFEGVPIYSKGVIRSISERESDFYILISGKRAVASDCADLPRMPALRLARHRNR